MEPREEVKECMFDDYEQVAETLNRMGWRSPCDAQWENLKEWCEKMKYQWHSRPSKPVEPRLKGCDGTITISMEEYEGLKDGCKPVETNGLVPLDEGLLRVLIGHGCIDYPVISYREGCYCRECQTTRNRAAQVYAKFGTTPAAKALTRNDIAFMVQEIISEAHSRPQGAEMIDLIDKYSANFSTTNG